MSGPTRPAYAARSEAQAGWRYLLRTEAAPEGPRPLPRSSKAGVSSFGGRRDCLTFDQQT